MALRYFADSDEVLVFDRLWGETHLVDGPAGCILDLMAHGKARSLPELMRLLDVDESQAASVKEYLRSLEKLNLLTEIQDIAP